MVKVICHIDLNAFFVRAEEIKNPTLINKPVAIGHEGRGGIVSTASYEARKYGVQSGMSMAEAKKRCPNLIIVHGDYRFYSLLHHEFINFVKSYTKLVEVASIDECFADFTDKIKGVEDVEGFFRKLQNDLFIKTKLKCSIGIGPSKFLSKMGSDLHKPMGLTIIRRRDIPILLFPLPVKDMFGIGKKTYPRLENIGIKTIGELYNNIKNNDEETFKILGSFSETLFEWLNGYGSDEIILEARDPKSISVSFTLKEDTSNYEIIKENYKDLVHELVYRLEKEGKEGSSIMVSIKDTSFKTYLKSATLKSSTKEYLTIFNEVMKLYEKNFLDIKIRAIGVHMNKLINPYESFIQRSLFDKVLPKPTISSIIEEINLKMKKPILKRASEIKKDGH